MTRHPGEIRKTTAVLAVVLMAALGVLLVGAAMWISLGVLTAHAAAAKPSIQNCATTMPHVGVGR
jgi:hypothetical protein